MYNKAIICYIMMNSERQGLTYIGLLLNVRNWNRIIPNALMIFHMYHMRKVCTSVGVISCSLRCRPVHPMKKLSVF